MNAAFLLLFSVIVALAERRCLACGAKAMCSELISAGRSEGYALFCPNAHYIEQIRSRLL
ncbi:MAG: hypothetical protein EPO20_12820 [Betaproteobacteria bacterium]|nr:MAG: hypothetical protein EPO20_12820 [Betaproteobacteria bacterium]